MSQNYNQLNINLIDQTSMRLLLKKQRHAITDCQLNEICVLWENEWENLTFKDLNIQQIEENVVLVTGILTSRKAKEIEVVSLEFQHLWWLKDGKIIKFLDQ